MATLIGGLKAELVLGARLGSRHGAVRLATAWAVGLAALLRVLVGAVAASDAAQVEVALAGLLAAAGAPRLFVRGGAFVSLRWVRIGAVPAVTARIAGAVLASAMVAAAASCVLVGAAAFGPAVLVAAVGHAAVVAGIGAPLAPAWGCSVATVLPLLLVATGVDVPGEWMPAAAQTAVLLPPGRVAVGWLEGTSGTFPQAGVWGLVGALGIVAITRRAARPAARTGGRAA